jgi:rubrerythrin
MSPVKQGHKAAAPAAARKSAAKKAGARNPVARKAAARKAAAKSAVKRPPARKKAAVKKAVVKKAVAKEAAATKSTAKKSAAKAPRSLADFMAHAWAMEIEAAERYSDFADAMETHNNREVAAMFRTMAGYENKHAEQILAEMGWSGEAPTPAGGYRWHGFEAPESAPIDEVHYLMQPWHALQLALAAEERAARFFASLAAAATTDAVRRAAQELEAEEREHVELVKAWIRKVPPPDRDWARDPDPPRYTD